MENLTRESILEAIQKIDENPELIKGRSSSTYDLVYNGKKYPPILVLSEANQLVGGSELFLSDFGNNAKKAFNKLEKFDFVIKLKNSKEIIEKRKNEFLNFLKTVHKNIGTSKQYLNWLDRVQEWFIDKEICDDSFNVWIDFNRIDFIENKLNNEFKEEWKQLNSENHYWYKSPWNAWIKFNKGEKFDINDNKLKQIIRQRTQFSFKVDAFLEALNKAELFFSELLQKRFVSSLLTKPFVILSGLSGSGKTKLAQAFVQWICTDEDQYKIVPVGADWTSREPLLGYPNALDQAEYIKPDNGVVDLILHAEQHDDLPHFLILDEMNLSHVERYFADFLSVMESNGKINFHSGKEKKSGVPAAVVMPDNLFIIGTINVDETTYMFSPKVLDRANAIEFRISEQEIEEFLQTPVKPDLERLRGEGSEMAESFLKMARVKEFENPANGNLNKTLVDFFGELKKTGAEFGYRSAYEIHRLINQLGVIDSELSDEEKLDIAIMQKLLPKLHGSRRKLCPVLVTLGGFCVDKDKIKDIEKQVFNVEDFDFKTEGVLYPLALEKITRMHTGAVDNGFASYAEA